jgi:hypothetical protein
MKNASTIIFRNTQTYCQDMYTERTIVKANQSLPLSKENRAGRKQLKTGYVIIKRMRTQSFCQNPRGGSLSRGMGRTSAQKERRENG